MKREGRQHGMVRTYHALPAPINPKPPSRMVNRVDSPPTAGIFTKVSNKPTNHSKFTGKCDRSGCAMCHIRAGCKSKDKAKGAYKLRGSEADLNYKLISWRVMGDRPVNKVPVTGFSASRILDDLVSYDREYDDDDDDDDNDDDEYVDDHDHDYEKPLSHDNGTITVSYPTNSTDNDDVRAIEDVDDEDEYLGFYDVTVMWDSVDGDEGWSLVGGGM